MTEFDTDIVYNDSDNQSYSRLILCIEEQDNKADPTSIDTRLYIGWDDEAEEYFLIGRRQDTLVSNYVPYAFKSGCMY